MNKILRKITAILVIALYVFIMNTQVSYAQESSPSAASRAYMVKYITIKNVLEKKNAPLSVEASSFTDTCFKYEIDCYLLPSISGLESSFGRFTASNSYNPFGWGGGYIYFESWRHGIDKVGAGLRKGYYDKGLTNPYLIGPVYAESPTWAVRVSSFIAQFKSEEENTIKQLDLMEKSGLL